MRSAVGLAAAPAPVHAAKCGPRRPSTGAISVAAPGPPPSATQTISAEEGAPDPNPAADSWKSRAKLLSATMRSPAGDHAGVTYTAAMAVSWTGEPPPSARALYRCPASPSHVE